MVVLVVLLIAGVVAGLLTAGVFFVVNRDAERATHGPVHATARVVQRELATHRRFAVFFRDRLSPARVTGLSLTVALALLIGVALLAFQVRRQSFVARADLDVAEWAATHATSGSTDFLRRFTDLGSTLWVLVITAVVALVEVLRTRSRGVILFLAEPVLGDLLCKKTCV